MSKVFSWDIVSPDGPWGKATALGAVAYEDGKEVESLFAVCPANGKWEESRRTAKEVSFFQCYDDMLRYFSLMYLEHAKEVDVVFDEETPRKAILVLDMFRRDFIGSSDYPRRREDIGVYLTLAGYDPDDFDQYNADHGILVPATCPSLPPVGDADQSPLHRARSAALCYMDLKQKMLSSR